MIGQRVAVAGRASSAGQVARTAPRGVARRGVSPAIPAIAGREFLRRALGDSILVKLMLAMSLLAAALVLYLAQASQESVLQFNIGYLQQQQTQLNARNADLSAQTTTLASAQRIESVATNQLHMVKPDTGTIVWIMPTVPRIALNPSSGISVTSAQRQSQPLAWMSRVATFVKSSF